MIEAILWDFGGVILSSPFDAFARYETSVGLPEGFIRRLNATNPDNNAWARFERSEITPDGFAREFEAEASLAGGSLSGHAVLGLLDGEIRPVMVEALRRCKDRFKVACLTNNVATTDARRPEVAAIMSLFDAVVESSRVGCRKPEVAFYSAACRLLEVEPERCVFLDDLGINLKPARAMGMQTIKVADPGQALDELEAITGLVLR